MTRVHLLTNIPAPYRLPVFAELGRHITLTVCFGRAAASDRQWQTAPLPTHVKSHILPYHPVRLPGIEFTWNPTYGRYLTHHPADIYIAGENFTDLLAVMATCRTARRQHKPFILWSEAIDTPYAKGHPASNIYRRWLYRHTDAFLAYGSRAQAFLEARGAPASRIVQGWQVVPAAQLPPPSRTRQQLGLNPTPLILAVGYLTRRKGFDLLIQAFQRLSTPAQLVIVGDGPERQRLAQMAANQPNIHFAGYLDDAEKSSWYAAADLFVLPTRHDPWGLVVNEAMAFGLPIVVTDAAGCAVDLVKGNGRIVPAENVPALAHTVDELLANKPLRQEMGKLSQELIRPYNVQNAAAAFLQAIRVAGAR
ncbi:MAG: hypothetical protein Kow0080_23050 [Candidatus Promineifilaceae bacterium]